MKKIIGCLAIVLAAAMPAAATPPSITVGSPLLTLGPDELSISLLGTEVSLAFEDVSTLNLLTLGLSVHLVNPFDTAFRARLPSGVGLSALPVLLRVEPPSWAGLQFRGLASFEIHTHLLPYGLTIPLRIFAAPVGGPFQDITAAMGPGSYRARGTRGGFSEFLIVLDLRPINTVIATKLDALEDTLETYETSMPAPVYDDLEDRIATIRGLVASEDWEDAIAETEDFVEEVEDRSGTDIPNLWRAARDRQNVAGYLRASGLTLRFSLILKSML